MSHYINYDDAIAQMQGIGLIIDEPLKLATGTKSERCKVSGEGKEKRGWYRLYEWITRSGEVFITGSYGIWYGDESNTHKIEITKECTGCHAQIGLKEKTCSACGEKTFKQREFSDDEKAAFRARIAEDKKRAEAERNAEITAKARWATAVWRACREAQPGEHDYLIRKGLEGTGGARIFESNEGILLEGDAEEVGKTYKYLATFHGALVVPLCDEHGTVFGLQFILSRQIHGERIRSTGRDKEYWPAGMGVEGHYWLIGAPRGLMLEAEGYATGLRLHNATGLPVAIAFAANNLAPVAKQLAKRYRKRVRNLICADDDWLQKCSECKKPTPVADENCACCGKPHGKSNAGITRAQSAAIAVDGCAWVAPKFSVERPADRKGPTDFDDLASAEGVQVVTAQIEAKLDELGWRERSAPASGQSSPRAGNATQGGGERSALKSMLTIDEAVDRFALVFGGKGTMFDYQEHILVPKNDVLDILPEHGWRDMRSLKKVVRMDEVGFDPAGTDKRIICNLWGGWPTTPKRGSCDTLLELLEYLCCEEENYQAVFKWVLKWIAYPIQNPGAKMRTALVFHGPQGTGKNLFFEAVMAIYGEYGRIVDQAAIEDKFNDWASRKLMMIADEVVARQELYHVKNKLKSFVTGEWIRINPKNVAAHDERNHVNLVFLSNESQPLVLEKDDRRYTVIHTPEKLPAEFYQQVREELNNDGIAALHDYLLRLDIGDFDEHSKPPMTKAKENLIDYGLDSVQRFVNVWMAGEIENAPFCPCLGRHLFTVYRRWCDLTGERSPRSESQFIGQIRNIPRWKAGESIATFETLNNSVKKNRKMIIPPDLFLSISVSKDGKTQQRWLTECYYEFANKAGFNE